MILRALLALMLAGVTAVPTHRAPAPRTPVSPDTPFGPGEELAFDVRSSRFGRIGKAFMRVEGPETIRGREAFVLAFDFSAKVLLFRVSDETRSWFDPEALTSLRYVKQERSPLSDRDERVEIFPDRGVWAEDGDTVPMPTTAPLDELSFLYFIRTLPLADREVYRLERHFDARRNPVTVTVVGRERRLEAEGTAIAGWYDLVVVEMRVPDGRQDDGRSVIRLYLTDDEHRVPVRIESSMPVGGAMVMELTARTVARR